MLALILGLGHQVVLKHFVVKVPPDLQLGLLLLVLIFQLLQLFLVEDLGVTLRADLVVVGLGHVDVALIQLSQMELTQLLPSS